MRRVLPAIFALLATLGLAAPALAMPSPQDRAPAAPAVCSAFRATNPLRQVTVRTYDAPTTYTSNLAYVTGTCGATTFTIPPGRRAYAVVRTSAEVDCSGGPANQWCQARIVVNGAEANPVGTEPDSFAYDSNNGGQFDWHAAAMVRARPVLFACRGPLTCVFPVAVQYKTHAPGMSLWVDDQTLEVDATYA